MCSKLPRQGSGYKHRCVPSENRSADWSSPLTDRSRHSMELSLALCRAAWGLQISAYHGHRYRITLCTCKTTSDSSPSKPRNKACLQSSYCGSIQVLRPTLISNPTAKRCNRLLAIFQKRSVSSPQHFAGAHPPVHHIDDFSHVAETCTALEFDCSSEDGLLRCFQNETSIALNSAAFVDAWEHPTSICRVDTTLSQICDMDQNQGIREITLHLIFNLFQQGLHRSTQHPNKSFFIRSRPRPRPRPRT